ncbi:hypothetical protein AB6E53_02305 [Vibrio breoganii]|uniref:Uncharacterized protein n=1 Tax=Vibrio breoganii TaxID=553239 RepID=A0AAP8MX36_9VIBR|nr:hypothetical protein [Vibrio breoganii]PMP10219.1 hypothetical protein BCS93_11125 [Vibrio breoganii]
MNIDDKLTITGSETPEELEAMLAELDDLEIVDEQDEDDNETIELSSGEEQPQADQSDIDDNADSQSADAENDPQGGDEKAPIQSKDGKHTIPFDVLERERKEKADLKEKLDAMQGKETELEKARRLLELRNKQLDELGIEPDELIEDVDPMKVIEDFETENPEVAKAMKALAHKVQAQQPKEPEADATPAPNPAQEAISLVPEIQSILNEGGEKANKAFDIDDALKVDPLWRNKPLHERYAEVARRTNEFYAPQQPAQVQAQQRATVSDAVQAVENDLPASPSEIGTSNKHQGSTLDRMATASTSELQAMFDGLSPAEIDALLEQASI